MTTTTQTNKKTRDYLVYRNGSNSANQSLCNCAPVAIVTASTREEACKTDAPERPTLHDSAWLAADPSVTCWHNQHFSAVPVSHARSADLRAVEEHDGFAL